MDRLNEQQKAQSSHAERKTDVDVDAEHDPEVSRRASNAGLRREANKQVADASDEKKTALYIASNNESVGATKAALLHLAAQFHAWGPELDKAMKVGGHSGPSPSTDTVKRIYATARDEMNRIADLIAALPVGRQRDLNPSISTMTDAFVKIQVPITHALTWEEGEARESLPLKALLDAYNRYPGTKSVTPDAMPKGSPADVTKAMIEKQLMATDTAIDAIRAGNDDEAKRVVMHVRYLETLKYGYPTEMKGTQKRLAHMAEQLKALKESKPQLDDVLKYPRETLQVLSQ